MKKILLVVLLVAAVLGGLALMWTYGFTVVSIEEQQAKVKSEAFDAAAYVDGIWASKILPTMDEKAVDLSTVLNAMKPDANGQAPKDNLVEVANQYGLITVGEAHTYIVRGEGEVVSVNTGSSIGTMEVKVKGYDGSIKTLIYIGTRIPSDNSAVRDAVGFINFGDFKEQTQYGKVAAEINKRVLTDVLNPLDKDGLQGKTIKFVGAITIRTFNLVSIDLSKITIVPVKIEVVE